MSGFVSLYTAFSGLQAAQLGMDTTSHNISNAGTPGFTRQRVDLASRDPYDSLFGPMGNGVDILGVSRARDAFLDQQVRSTGSSLAQYSTLGQLLSGSESVMGEPNGGLTAAFGELWTSFANLALDPPSTASRLDVIAKLQDVAARVRSIADAWTAQATSASNELGVAVGEVNGLLAEVGALNRTILESAADGGPPNDLLDQRDRALDRLADLAGTTATITSDGSARVSLNGLALVSGVEVSELTFDPSTNTVVHSSGVAAKTGGQLAGYQAFLNVELPALQTSLDDFVADLVTTLNTQHAAGFRPDGAPGGLLLTATAGQEAATLQVAITDPDELAASATTGTPVPEYDGDNAQALADLRTAPSAAGAASIDDILRALIGDLAVKTASTLATADVQQGRATSAQVARDSANGVSIDEEMVNLITFQRSYEAASRVMTAVDQTLDTLINRTGVVGR